MEAIRDIDKVRRAMTSLGAREVKAGGNLAVVWDEELESASFMSSDREIGAHVRHGRPVRVIPVGPKLLQVLDSLERLASDRRTYGD